MNSDGCNVPFTGIEKDDFVEYHWECFSHQCRVEVKIIDEINNSSEDFSLIYMFDESLIIQIDLYRVDTKFIIGVLNKALKIAYDKYHEHKDK